MLRLTRYLRCARGTWCEAVANKVHSVAAPVSRVRRILSAPLTPNRSGVRQFLLTGGRLFRAISAVNAPLLVSFCGALILAMSPQTLEIYRIIASDFHSDPWPVF